MKNSLFVIFVLSLLFVACERDDNPVAPQIITKVDTVFVIDTSHAIAYEEYVAFVSQSGTDDPIATVVSSTLDVDLRWIYTGYIGNFLVEPIGDPDILPMERTFISFTDGTSGGNSIFFSAQVTATDRIWIYTRDKNGNLANGLFNRTQIIIRTYK